VRPTAVGLVMSPAARFFLMALARELKQRWDCQIHLYCSTAQDVVYYTRANADGTFASITNSEAGYRALPDDVPAAAELSVQAREGERRLGCTFNTLAVSDRHFGRGYALGGPGHPRSRMSEAWSYEQMVVSFSRACEFWDREFRELKLDLVLNASPVAARLA